MANGRAPCIKRLCEHGRERRRCKDCNPDYVRPVFMCEHHPRQPKQTCTICPGPRICPLHFTYRKGNMCGDCRKKKPVVHRRWMHTVADIRGAKPVFSHVIDEDKEIEEMKSNGATDEQVDKKRAFFSLLTTHHPKCLRCHSICTPDFDAAKPTYDDTADNFPSSPLCTFCAKKVVGPHLETLKLLRSSHIRLLIS